VNGYGWNRVHYKRKYDAIVDIQDQAKGCASKQVYAESQETRTENVCKIIAMESEHIYAKQHKKSIIEK
jgi:hypothetical protein